MDRFTGKYLHELYYQCAYELPYEKEPKYFKDKKIYSLMAEKINSTKRGDYSLEKERQIIQNFLNMVCFDTQGRGGDSTKLEELLDEYFQISEEADLHAEYKGEDDFDE